LEQKPNSRTVVATLTRQDIVDLYEVREALEVYAVGKVARQVVRKADLDRLQSLTDSIWPLKDELEQSGKAELDGDQMRRLITYDLGFHTLLMRLAANARMMKIVNDTRLLIRIFAMRRKGHGAALLEDIHRRHSDIIRAIAGQDPHAGMRAIAEHIQVSLHERLEDFDHWEIETALRQSLPFFFDVRPMPDSQ
jgi:DNA-binding GntR family transcriptional regulator